MHSIDVGVCKYIEHVKLQVCVSLGHDCDNCYFMRPDGCCHIGRYRDLLGACSEYYRTDQKSVIFKAVKETT